MRIAGIRAFVEIMRRGSLSAAADALNVSEPALSRQIAGLEADLELELFSRRQRQLVATEAGEALLDEAQGLLDYYSRFPEVAQDIKSTPGGRLRIVAMPRIASALATPAIAQFKKRRPDVNISIEVHARRSLEQWISRQHFEIGVGALPTFHASVDTERALSVPLVAVLPPRHPLAKAESVRATDLIDEPLIATKTDTLIWQQIEPIFKAAKATPKPIITSSSTQLACNLVASGIGYTICDPLVASTAVGSVKTVPLKPRRIVDFGLMWRRGQRRTENAVAFGEVLKELSAQLEKRYS